MSGSALRLGLVAAGGLSLAAWIAILADPRRPWDLEPIGEDLDSPGPPSWPSVTAVVPARDEAALLPTTLPALLAQDYPGSWRVVLVDDRSRDGTAGVARTLAGGRLGMIEGESLPHGWAGKVWALDQGARAAGDPDYLLFTDADIVHAPGSLRALVTDAVGSELAATSRMARLHCRSLAERLVIPPFLLFFNLLYPMRRVNDPASPTAALAGGCILLRRDALERAGGLAAIRGEIIDDVNLGRLLKGAGEAIRLAVSRTDVVSVRSHSLASAWRMVRRTAFDELRYSWLRLGGTVFGLLVLFAVPPGLVAVALAGGSPARRVTTGVLGGGAWALSAAVYRRTVRYFGLHPLWAATLPAGGVLYGGMTVDSAARHLGRLLRREHDSERW